MSDQQLISNRYQLGELLNEGGMGLVYHGTDTYSGQPVAIKLLKPEMVAGQPDLVKRFSREAEVLRALNHPNIVEVMATVTGEDDQYIVMEYVGGGSLRELLDQEKQLAISRVLEITLDLTDALTRAHRLYIIHRDLKPANVLLESDGTPRLSDFGLAKVGTSNIIGPSGLTQAGTILGTIDYMSPEACRGEEADARADIWALGVMLFEMLTGTRPFSDPSTAGILSAILTQPVPDLEALRPETPTDLADLIYRMLEKDREERVPSVRLVGAELEVILLGTTDSSDRTSRPVPPAMRFVTSTPHPFGVPRHNLPLQTTPFVGRKVELSDLASLISEPDNRLITLLGPGGAGKTRLALEAAKAQLSNFSDGVYFVSMASLTSAENIVPAIAEAVGYQFFEHMEPREQLVGFFSEKKILLVLDNFEHLLDGVGLVSEILRSAPFVKVLATSRQSLNLQQEVHFRIVGMDVPEETLPISLEKAGQYSAISLFLQSARRVSPNFELKTEDLEAVIRICHLVTGSPLGILLASAWTEMFSPQEIAEEISGNLDFLETEVSDISGRHRSIRAVFESSWNQLSEEERKTFRRLSIFRGGFKRQAAQAVCGARLPMLITLVRKSLLHRDPASGRYEIHELLRQYAKEQLDSSGEADLTLLITRHLWKNAWRRC
jgi:non-specific serine/threonine protein kinase